MALAIAALVAAAGAGAPVARADFAVFPSVLDVKRGPREASVGAVNVRLTGERGRRFVVEAQDLVQQADGSFTTAPVSASPFSASQWVQVTPQRFSGAPNRTQPIEYRVLVPERAEPGDHVASLTGTPPLGYC